MRERLSRDSVLMSTAFLFAQRATCERAQVGAILSRKGRILVTGYNGAPAGMDHCSHACDCDWNGESTFPHREWCASQRGCQISVHAEANAIAWAARFGIATDQATLHTTVAPCLACAQLLINAGIYRVVYAMDYRVTAGIELLTAAEVIVEKYENG